MKCEQIREILETLAPVAMACERTAGKPEASLSANNVRFHRE